MSSQLPAGRIAALFLSLVVWTASVRPARAQSDATPTLEPFVVVATRNPEDIRTLGTSVDLITPDELAREQITTPAAALGSVPGAPAFANGALGSDISLFLRGADSDQTLFLVDGIPLNDSNTDYSVFLGGARLGATDSIEIARGPQSTLYGSAAIGGVVSIAAQKGSGTPTSDAILEAGSFDTYSAAWDAQGSRDSWDWSVSASGLHTANQRPNNIFDTGDLVLRIDRDLANGDDIGATLRGFEARYGDPGDMYTDDFYAHETESNWLGTVFADLKLAPAWTAHITVGGQDRRFDSFDESPGVFVSTSTVEDRRGILDAQTTFSGLPEQRITVGINGEDETTRDNSFGNIDRKQLLFAAFAEEEWQPLHSVFLTGGARYDDFDTFGSAVTGRATAAWLSADRSLKLRASYGSGFNAPSFLDLYGIDVGYQGNLNLRPERSNGGDAGFDFYLPNNAGSFSASVFRNDYRDLIVFDFNVSPGTTENVDQARTDGLELELKYRLPAALEFHATYTHLNADDETDGTRLLRRPRNSGSADLWRSFGSGLSAGAGVEVVAGRQDVDALTFLTVNDPDYAVVRIYGEWRINPHWALQARVENLLDKKYQPVNGYPALGIGAFGSVKWSL